MDMNSKDPESCEEEICITSDAAGLYKKYSKSRFEELKSLYAEEIYGDEESSDNTPDSINRSSENGTLAYIKAKTSK